MIEPMDLAGYALAEVALEIRLGTVREAAERSYGYTSGQYSLVEMEQQIAAIRAGDYDSPVAQTQGSVRPGDQTRTAVAGEPLSVNQERRSA